MQFSIRLLLIVTATISVLALCAADLSQTTYLISCVAVPIAFALLSRYFFSCGNGFASLVIVTSAIAISSMMMAYGSYDQTFNNGAAGFLVGDGWNSVAAAAFFGGLLGIFGAALSMLLYFGLTAIIGKPSCLTPDKTAE